MGDDDGSKLKGDHLLHAMAEVLWEMAKPYLEHL